MIIKNKGKRKEKKKYYEAVETGRVAKGVEQRVELFVSGSMVEELEVDGRVGQLRREE